MPEKELRKKVIGKNGLSNSLLALKIVFDLIPQILLVYLISSLITNNINEGNLKYILIILGYFEPPVRVFGATVPEKGSHEFRCSRATFVPCL